MISFDLLYGYLSLIFGVFALWAMYYIRSALKNNYSVFLTMLFNRPKRVYVAFIALFLSAAFLAVGYAISFIAALSNPTTIDWEYTNIFVFFFFVLFLLIIGQNYRKRPKKISESWTSTPSENPVESPNKTEQPEKPEENEPEKSNQNIDQKP